MIYKNHTTGEYIEVQASYAVVNERTVSAYWSDSLTVQDVETAINSGAWTPTDLTDLGGATFDDDGNLVQGVFNGALKG